MTVPIEPRRLPVWVVFKRSFAYAWERRDAFAVPYLIYALVTIAVDLFVQYAFGAENTAGTALAFAFDETFAMAFAVGIHRFVLLGEAGRGAAFFRWDRNFVQYVLTALMLTVGAGFAAIVLVALFDGLGRGLGVVSPDTGMPVASPGASALSLLMLFAMVAIATVFARLLLTLPAAALGQPDRLRLVWAATRGNGARLLATAFLVLLPFAVIEFSLLRNVLSVQPEGEAAAAASQVGLAIQIVLGLVSPAQLVVLTIMLALDYDALVRGGGPTDPVSRRL